MPLPTRCEYQNNVYNHDAEIEKEEEEEEEIHEQYYSNEEWDPDDIMVGRQSNSAMGQIRDGNQAHLTNNHGGDRAVKGKGNGAPQQRAPPMEHSHNSIVNNQRRVAAPIVISKLGFPPTPRESEMDGGEVLPHSFNDDEIMQQEQHNSSSNLKRVRFSDTDLDAITEQEEKENTVVKASSSQRSPRSPPQAAATSSWEEISSSPMGKWKSSPRKLLIEDDNGDDESAWSLQKSTMSATSVQSKTATTKDNKDHQSYSDFNIFPWNESEENEEDWGGRVESIPQWKLRKLTAEEQMLAAEKQAPPPRTTTTEHQHDGAAQRYVFAKEREQSVQPQTPPSQMKRTPVYPFSDGDISSSGYDTSDIDIEGGERAGRSKSRTRSSLRFFKSRRKYNSEGERSDSEWESSADEQRRGRSSKVSSFSMSPSRLRGRSKQKKRTTKKVVGRSSMSPLGMKLFGHNGHRHHDIRSLERVDIVEDKYTTSYESMPLADSPPKARSNIYVTTGQIIKAEQESNLAHKQSIKGRVNLNDSMETEASNLSATDNLNTTHLSQETPTVSNLAKTPTASNIAKTRVQQRHLPPSSKPPGLPRGPTSSAESSNTISNYHPVKALLNSMPPLTEQSVESNDDDETVSTLGSLVTKDTNKSRNRKPSTKILSSDQSTVTELSEIERLRKENDRLREELENASQLSSNVVSMYADTLKRENNRLKEEIEFNGSKWEEVQQPQTLGEKAPLETLLGHDHKKRSKKHRRRAAAARREGRQIADFNLLPPAAHLINGVDFDDDSTTSFTPHPRLYSERLGGGTGCETAELLLKKSWETTRQMASQVKAAAQDMNNERRMSNVSRPLDCFNNCARKKSSPQSMSVGISGEETASTGSNSFIYKGSPKRRKGKKPLSSDDKRKPPRWSEPSEKAEKIPMAQMFKPPLEDKDSNELYAIPHT